MGRTTETISRRRVLEASTQATEALEAMVDSVRQQDKVIGNIAKTVGTANGKAAEAERIAIKAVEIADRANSKLASMTLRERFTWLFMGRL